MIQQLPEGSGQEEANMNKYVENPSAWTAPVIPEKIPQGDMPGDKIEIGEDHINKANLIFRELLGQIRELKKEDADRKIVLTVCGGSGVGKSETASLLSFYFNQIGMKAYTLSGDNYPHRIPKYNDAERVHVFRESAIRGMVKDGTLFINGDNDKVALYNVAGIKLYEGNANNINLNNFGKGLLILKVYGKNGNTETYKFMF